MAVQTKEVAYAAVGTIDAAVEKIKVALDEVTSSLGDIRKRAVHAVEVAEKRGEQVTRRATSRTTTRSRRTARRPATSRARSSGARS
jgi:hypothetical protein